MKENKTQKEFRLYMNDLLATDPTKTHIFESKNDYKDYPCDCGATNNKKGTTCWRYKASNIKEIFYKKLTSNKETL